MRRPVRAAVGVLCAVLPLLLASCAGHSSRSSSTPSGGRPSHTSSPAASSSAPAATTTTAPAGDAAVEAALSRMDPRQRVAQLFVVGVPLTGLAAGDALVQQGVGGVFLAGRSTASTGDLGTVTGRGPGWPPTRRAARCRP
jgi:hypothetical protein